MIQRRGQGQKHRHNQSRTHERRPATLLLAAAVILNLAGCGIIRDRVGDRRLADEGNTGIHADAGDADTTEVAGAGREAGTEQGTGTTEVAGTERDTGTTESVGTEPEAGTSEYAASGQGEEAIYEAALGEFRDVYPGTQSAYSESECTVRLAEAEAKLLEAAVVLPLPSEEGNTFLVCNLNRRAYENSGGDAIAISMQSEAQKTLTRAAMNNVHFRRALFLAVNRTECVSPQRIPCEEAARATPDASPGGASEPTETVRRVLATMPNAMTAARAARLSEAVTIATETGDYTYEAGVCYGELVQAQLKADGMRIRVFDSKAKNGRGSGEGFDGWYRRKTAAKELAEAVSELKELGYKIEADSPIVLDLPYPSADSSTALRAEAYRQSIEAVLGDAVQLHLIDAGTVAGWQQAGSGIAFGYEANYDLCEIALPAADAIHSADPSGTLSRFLPEGDLLRYLGLF